MFDALIILGIIFILLTIPFIIRLVWNIRLVKFQKRNFIKPSTSQKLSISNNLVATSLLLVVGLFSIVGGSKKQEVHKGVPTLISFEQYEMNNKTYENAKTFSSKEEFNSIFSNIIGNYRGAYYHFGLLNSDTSFNPTESVDSPKEGGTTDTYNQVAGVTEGDIAKYTEDGKHLIYIHRNTKTLHRISLDGDGEAVETLSLKLRDNFYFTEMFLYKEKLVLFSHSYKTSDTIFLPYYNYPYPYIYNYSLTTYFIYDINTLNLLDEGELLGSYQELRQVDNILYVATNDYVNSNTEDDKFYENVYYFKGKFNSNAITRLYSINLDSHKVISKIGFVGSLDAFYMGIDEYDKKKGKIVITNVRWNYDPEDPVYVAESNVILINYNNGMFEYAGSAVVEGMALTQYYIDVRYNMIRIVTTHGKDERNSLYIFKEDMETDKLELLSILNEGIGKERESVKSVTYTETQVQIVTFYQTDPLYTIDLTNPRKPFIANIVEEPGYSSGLIVWDEALGYTIGIGYMANLDGRTTGIKVSAYSKESEDPIQTIEFSYNIYGYLYAEALGNNGQRMHLLVDKGKNILAFISHGFTNGGTKVLLFNVDFSNKEKPIKLDNELFDKSFDRSIEKLLRYKNKMHILSRDGIYTYDLESKTLSEVKTFITEKEIQFQTSYDEDGLFGIRILRDNQGVSYEKKELAVVINSKEELISLCELWNNNAFNEDSLEFDSALSKLLRTYDDEYFQTKSLIIYTNHNYNVYRPKVTSVKVGIEITLKLTLEIIPEEQRIEDYDIYRTFVLEVDKEDIDNLDIIRIEEYDEEGYLYYHYYQE